MYDVSSILKDTMNKTIIDALNFRYATKQFDPSKKLDEKTLNTILEAGRLSPSSYGLQPWKFVVVTDEEVRKKLKNSGFNQPQIIDASHIIVIAARDNVDESYIDEYMSLIAETKGTKSEELEGFKRMIIGSISGQTWGATFAWNTKQTYIPLGAMIETSALLGVDSCPMEGFNPVEFDEILGLLESGYRSVVLLAVGYRLNEDPASKEPKVRFPAEKIIKKI